MTKVIISIGSNLGDRHQYLQFAVDQIAALPKSLISKISSIYETAPQTFLDQPSFFNAIIELETELEPEELLTALRRIEHLANRERKVVNGPRTLDLDIIIFGESTVENDDLQLPHPRAHLRQFVLIPWLELDAAAQLGELGLVANINAGLADQGVTKLTELRLA
jgi:2-amino-4-hydroxy-6-hydroxymethyldihydropteridine diphosphokinase